MCDMYFWVKLSFWMVDGPHLIKTFPFHSLQPPAGVWHQQQDFIDFLPVQPVAAGADPPSPGPFPFPEPEPVPDKTSAALSGSGHKP